MEQLLVYFYTYKEAIFIIALSIFLGIEVISNVPSVLHTPLMSGANAISGVIIIGGIILVGHADTFAGAISLSQQEGRWQIENLGQTTIMLNGTVFSGTQPLSHGDVIAVDQVHFRFENAKNSK
jgi:NAD/NADP transhydrogenase alpha subunit